MRRTIYKKSVNLPKLTHDLLPQALRLTKLKYVLGDQRNNLQHH